MRRRLAVITLVVAAAVCGQSALQACGDKFFPVGRGDRFARAYASLYPGRIVIHTGGSSATSKGLNDGRLQKYFTRAGHRVSVARDAAALEKMLIAGDVDLIIAGLQEALDLLPRVQGASGATLVPVADGKRSVPASQHQFAATLSTSDKITGFLAKIEDLMKSRATAHRQRT
jgi:hypothetical protein